MSPSNSKGHPFRSSINFLSNNSEDKMNNAGERRRRRLKDPSTLRVFFSSPFGGMEGERVELTRKYFPHFHHACNARGIQFVPVDMRWGITSEAADNAQVINICLREIDRSDVFIGFFGQRYGWHGDSDDLLQRNFDNAVGRYPWLDKVRDKGVTELEFLRGHLNQPGEIPAVICFRDKAYDDAVREDAVKKGDKKMIFKYTSESDHATELMDDLIRRVKETDSQLLGLELNYSHPNEGAKFMYETVWDCCMELLSEAEKETMSPLEKGRQAHLVYVSSLTSLYCGGEKQLENLSEMCATGKPGVLVTGTSGSGKSALLANFMRWLEQKDRSVCVIYYFVGCAPGTTDPSSILKYLVAELQHLNGDHEEQQDKGMSKSLREDENENIDEYNLYTNFKNEMERLSSGGKKLVIVIDGLQNTSKLTKTAKHLYWLPDKFPAGVSVVMSTITADTATFDLLVKERGFTNLAIQPLTPDTQREMCQKTLIKNGKELSPSQLERVVAAEQTQNPLFLKIVLSEISIYGNFRLLDQKIDSLIYSDGVKDLLDKVLQRLEEDYNVKEHPDSLVHQVLAAVAVSHEGLTESELMDMFGVQSQVWSPFYFAVENFLLSHSGLLRFAFSELQQAVEARYLDTPQKKFQTVSTLINYFERVRKNSAIGDGLKNPHTARVAAELPWLYQLIDNKEGLTRCLCDLRVFHALEGRSVYQLIDLWRETNLDQLSICEKLLHAFDRAVSDLYTVQEMHFDCEPPGYVLMPALNSMKEMFSVACFYKPHIQVLQRLLKILEGIEGRIDEDVRQVYLRDNRYFLSCALVNDCNYKAAEPVFNEVMAECRSCLESNEDPRVQQTLAFSCHGLGVLHLKQRNYEEAEPLFHESKRIHETLGNSICVAQTLTNLGNIKLETGHPEEALQLFTVAMETYEKHFFGHLPLNVGTLLTNMGLCYRRMDKPDQAKEMYFRSLEVKSQAVGPEHEVIAMCYMNLGSLEIICHRNFTEAEVYTRKALKILELNKVKLEQTEMWQTQENLVGILAHQEKHAEALPIFLRVFSMLKRENIVAQAHSYTHRLMLTYMLSLEMYKEVADVCACHALVPKFRTQDIFTALDSCDQKLTEEERPARPRELTVAYALEELWPGDNSLTGYMVQNYVLPSGDVELLLRMLETMDEKNPDFVWTTYDAGAIWCEGAGNKDALVKVLKKGLEKYPDAIKLKTKLFDHYRLSKQYDLAYPLIKEILPSELDNQGFVLVSGEVALHNGDFDLCQELWEKASTLEGAGLAERARQALESLKGDLASEELGNERQENSEENPSGHEDDGQMSQAVESGSGKTDEDGATKMKLELLRALSQRTKEVTQEDGDDDDEETKSQPESELSDRAPGDDLPPMMVPVEDDPNLRHLLQGRHFIAHQAVHHTHMQHQRTRHK
ncbi:TPR repeat-containing protein DDB_G0287407 [Aplysia californica]|uniref:Nephrocystin-3 n=1 Tax=Aplysia californica TaxID=6500 RepID=A0ABM0K910_APLCA|nr:TPR repeat-containing protein DDB_G0287407 [Aplysia californica]